MTRTKPARTELPRVAIVGRPNVGKSSLFNAIARRRIAIVDERPGVTRDRVTAEIVDFDRSFELVDTGGIGGVDRDDLSLEIQGQIQVAVTCADVIVFVVDARSGLVPGDAAVAGLLRPLGVPIVLAANKVDAPPIEPAAYEFAALGLGDPIPVSARERRGLNELLDAVVAHLPPAQPLPEPELRIAIVGRRNVGKSTFLNALAGEDRVIVSEVPGTTRDAVDVRIAIGDRTIVVIDTAGVRRRKQVQGSVDLLSQRRTLAAIERCDVAFFMLDAARKIARLDKQLAQVIGDSHKPCVIILNKWDLTSGKGVEPSKYERYVSEHLPGLSFAPIVCASALTGLRCAAAVEVAFSIFVQANARVGTGELNRALGQILAEAPPRRTKRHEPKLYFASQVKSAPPTFVLFVNLPAAFPADYRRYIAGRLRERLGFPEVPVRLILRQRESRYG